MDRAAGNPASTASDGEFHIRALKAIPHHRKKLVIILVEEFHNRRARGFLVSEAAHLTYRQEDSPYPGAPQFGHPQRLSTACEYPSTDVRGAGIVTEVMLGERMNDRVGLL